MTTIEKIIADIEEKRKVCDSAGRVAKASFALFTLIQVLLVFGLFFYPSRFVFYLPIFVLTVIINDFIFNKWSRANGLFGGAVDVLGIIYSDIESVKHDTEL